MLSLIGDSISVIGHEPTVGSRTDKNDRMTLPVKDRSFDVTAEQAARDEIQRLDTNSAVIFLTSSDPKLFELQDRLFSGQGEAAAPLGAVKAALQGQSARYLILVLKHRHEAELRFQHSYMGSGYLEGIGFYIDQTKVVTNAETHAIDRGFLGVFAYIKVLLVDANTMTVVREQVALKSGTTSITGELNPWAALTPTQKLVALNRLIARAVKEAMPNVLQAR